MNEQLETSCTAVLFTVPLELASKLEGFLRANGIACRIRPNQMSPEQVAEAMVRQAQPGAARMLDTPFVGRMVRSRMRKDLKAEIGVTGGAMPAMYDVLVRPEDLPTAGTAGQGADNWTPDDPQRAPTLEPPAAASSEAPTTVLCQRPWDRAWELVAHLGEQGIQAAILPNEESTTAPSIDTGMFRVGVRAGDLERARTLIEA